MAPTSCGWRHGAVAAILESVVGRVLLATVCSAVVACGGRVADDWPPVEHGPGTPGPPLPGQPTPADPCAGGDGEPASAPAHPPLLEYLFDGDVRNTGTLGADFDGISHDTGFVPGVHGEGAVVGVPSWVELPGSASVLSGAEELTIALWVAPDFAPGGHPILDCRSFYRGLHTYHGVYDDTRLTTCFGAGHPAVGPGGCASFDGAAGWHSLVYRWRGTGTAVELFWDGRRVAELSDGSDFEIFASGTNDIRLGHHNMGSGWGPAAHVVDELGVYDRAFDDRDQCVNVVGGRWCAGSCVVR